MAFCLILLGSRIMSNYSKMDTAHSNIEEEDGDEERELVSPISCVE